MRRVLFDEDWGLLDHELRLAGPAFELFPLARSESGEAAQRLANLSSTTFDARLQLARSVSNETHTFISRFNT